MKPILLNRFLCLFFGAFICAICPAFSQDIGDSVKHQHDEIRKYAYRLLSGNILRLDYRGAANYLFKISDEGDGEASNALGIMYKFGLGTVPNDQKALALFEKAARLGYGKAYYNIGLMYKYGHYVPQDLDSMQCFFSRAREHGFERTEYIDGYTAFKGQGIEQNYNTAFEKFRQGAEKGGIVSMYMLGICYLYGRGTPFDEPKGKYWMEQSALGGFEQALQFISDNKGKKFQAELLAHSQLKSVENIKSDAFSLLTPQAFSLLKNKIQGIEGMEGIWEGKIISYDWSGKEIEDESKLQLSLNIQHGGISGIWTESDTISSAITGRIDSSGWKFQSVVLQDHDFPLELRTANLECDTVGGREYICGDVSFYCNKTREYSNPKYVVLKRIGITSATQNSNEIQEKAKAYLDPLNNEIHVDLTLGSAQTIRFALYGMDGRSQHLSSLKNFPAGVSTYFIPVSALPIGAYTLHIEGSAIRQSITLFK